MWAGVRDKFLRAQHVLGIQERQEKGREGATSPLDFSDPQIFLDQVVSPCPRSGDNGEGVIATYNQIEQFDGGQAFKDSVLNPGGRRGGGGGEAAPAAPARGSEEGGQRGLDMFPDQFRPMFLVLLDAMHNVQFSDRADVERDEWAAFEPQHFNCQGGADVQLAQTNGGYLYSNILQSLTLRDFFGDLL
jgi:hypothetical protein